MCCLQPTVHPAHTLKDQKYIKYHKYSHLDTIEGHQTQFQFFEQNLFFLLKKFVKSQQVICAFHSTNCLRPSLSLQTTLFLTILTYIRLSLLLFFTVSYFWPPPAVFHPNSQSFIIAWSYQFLLPLFLFNKTNKNPQTSPIGTLKKQFFTQRFRYNKPSMLFSSIKITKTQACLICYWANFYRFQKPTFRAIPNCWFSD